MKVSNVDHIGIAVTNLDETIKLYEDILGIKCQGTEVVEEQKVRVAFFQVGDAEFEFLESTSPDGPIAKFIEKNGGRTGIQHIAVRVENIEESIKEMESKGYTMLDKTPRYGAGNSSIAFCHPKSTGILLELCQRNK